MIKVGTEIDGGRVYGPSGRGINGVVTKIDHPEQEGDYIMADVITIKWSDGQVARFYRGDLNR